MTCILCDDKKQTYLVSWQVCDSPIYPCVVQTARGVSYSMVCTSKPLCRDWQSTSSHHLTLLPTLPPNTIIRRHSYNALIIYTLQTCAIFSSSSATVFWLKSIVLHASNIIVRKSTLPWLFKASRIKFQNYENFLRTSSHLCIVTCFWRVVCTLFPSVPLIYSTCVEGLILHVSNICMMLQKWNKGR